MPDKIQSDTPIVVLCPNCSHAMDIHKAHHGIPCSVFDENAKTCECQWTPNDIAVYLIQAVRDRIVRNLREARKAKPPYLGFSAGRRTFPGMATVKVDEAVQDVWDVSFIVAIEAVMEDAEIHFHG